MSVGADSLMAFVDVSRLFNKEILQKLSVKQDLDDIGDATIASVSSGQFIKWNGSAWVNHE